MKHINTVDTRNLCESAKLLKLAVVVNAKLLANQHVKLAVVLPTKLAKITKKVSN